jgi:sugar lactone lactonase YvrE
MHRLSAEPAFRDRNQLGEGPHWLPDTGELVWVDILAGDVHRWLPGTDHRHTVHVGSPVGFAIRRENGGLVIGRRRAVVAIDPDGRESVVAAVEPRQQANRFNDAKCDVAGRLWAGTMPMDAERPGGNLYRIEPSGEITLAVTGTTISNGIGWSPDGERMYFIDSPTRRIDAFDFDVASGAISARRPFAYTSPDHGVPDGLAVDVEGGVWVAMFGAGVVRRYAPDGSCDVELDVPAPQPASIAFGGPHLEQLYVTTARVDLSPGALQQAPLSGSVFVAAPGVAGLPVHGFCG